MAEAKKILIVDDEDDIRELAHISLARVGGFQVIAARSGQEGLELARSERPDAILLDAQMPGMDGPATLAALKADEATAAIPVIFLTGSVQVAERERFEELGAGGLLPKPFDPMTLADQIRELLGWS